jgi:hypothetical protein
MSKPVVEPTLFSDEAQLQKVVLRLQGNILGLVLGIIFGVVIFIATNWLVLKGGDNVGQHLHLLRNFYWGYSVTLRGSFIGAAYGFVTGYLVGWAIARIYNWIVQLQTK